MTSTEMLLHALQHYGITVTNTTNNKIEVTGAYVIEVEANNTYKLLQQGYVIAPFNDLDELCQFIMRA